MDLKQAWSSGQGVDKRDGCGIGSRRGFSGPQETVFRGRGRPGLIAQGVTSPTGGGEYLKYPG